MNNKKVTLGITGHRYEISSKIYQELFDKITKLLSQKGLMIDTVVSSLADGVDRVVAKHLMQVYGARLIAVLPFEAELYKDDFLAESKLEFDDFTKKAANIIQSSSLLDTSRDEAYLIAGQKVVDMSDILVSIWDNLPARGKGGTADIIEYAKRQHKEIVLVSL